MRPTARSVFGYCLVFAFVSALLAFLPLARQSYAMFFDAHAPLSIESAIGSFTPVPRPLMWSPATENLITRFATLPSAGLLGLEVVLYGILLYGVLRILNPTFRVTT